MPKPFPELEEPKRPQLGVTTPPVVVRKEEEKEEDEEKKKEEVTTKVIPSRPDWWSVYPGVPYPEEYETEPFPGYMSSMKELHKQSYKAHKETERLGRKVEYWLNNATVDPELIETEMDRQWHMMLMDSITQQKEAVLREDSIIWKQDVLSMLPTLMLEPARGIRSVEDVLKIIPWGPLPLPQPAEPELTISEGDKQWLEDIFQKLEYMVLPEEIAALVDMSPEEAEKYLLNQILSKPKAHPVNINLLTMEELTKAFQGRPVGELPATLTAADIREMATNLGLDEETKQKMDDLHEFNEELLADSTLRRSYMRLLMAGLETPTTDPLTLGQLFKMSVTQPALASYELLYKYFQILSKPLAAKWVLWKGADNDWTAKWATRWAGDIETLTEQYQRMGETEWRALALAWDESEQNVFLKFAMEMLTDPTSYLGIGIIPKTIGKLPYAGRFFGAIDEGWKLGWDAVFLGGRKAAASVIRIPKTIGQQSVKFAQESFMQIRAYTRKLYGKPLVGLNAQQLRESAQLAIHTAKTMPRELGNEGVRMGRSLLQHDFIEDDLLRQWLTDAGVSGVDELITSPQMLHDINYAIDDLMRGLKLPDETAQIIATKIPLTVTRTNLKRLGGFITRWSKGIEDDAMKLFAGDNPKAIMRNVLDHFEQLAERKFSSPIYQFAMQGGRATGFFTKLGNKIVRNSWVTAFDRHFTAPLANQYLLFTNYGPFNVIESSMRSFLGAGEMFYPGRADPVAELLGVTEDLVGTPYEFVNYMDKGVARLEMATISPKTGEVMVFKQGKLPGITKDLPWGFSIKIGQQDYIIKSLQHWNDMFADIGMRQRAWYFLTKWKQELARVAPTQFSMIDSVFTRHQYLLDQLTFLSRTEKDEALRLVKQSALGGPELIDEMAEIPMLDLARRRAHYELNKELAKCTDIYFPHKQYIRERTLSGRIFQGIDEDMELVANNAREFNLLSLEAETKMYSNMARGFVQSAPETADDLLRRLADITNATDAMAARTDSSRKIVMQRAMELTGKEAEQFHTATWQHIRKFILNAETELNYMTDMMRKITRGQVEFGVDWPSIQWVNITPAQQAELKGLIDDLPVEMRSFLEKVEYNPAKARGYKSVAFYDFDEKTIVLGKESWDRKSFIHEMMHSYQADRMMQGDYKFALDLAEATHGKGSLQYEITNRAAQEHWLFADFMVEMQRRLPYTELPSEILANGFQLAATGKVDPSFAASAAKMTAFIESHLPLKLRPIQMTDDMIKQADDLFEAVDVHRQNYALARLDEDRIRTNLLRNKPKKAGHDWWTSVKREVDEQAWAPYQARKKQIDTRLDAIKDNMAKTLGIDEPPLPKPEPVDVLTPAHVASVMGITGDDLSRGIIKSEAGVLLVNPKEEFINIIQRKIARFGNPDDFGFSEEAIGHVYDQLWRDIGLDPKWAAKEPMVPTMSQLEDIRQTLHRLKGTMGIPENDYLAYRQYLSGIGDDLRKLPVYADDAGRAEWTALKEEAMSKARTAYHLDFTNYDNNNMVDALMRLIFPFWTYESQRWFWLPRTFLRTPGTGTALGRYMDYTDQGYIPIPGTDFQVNPLRGTVFMGGFRRLYLRDFPEYYDAFPGMEQIDFIQRAGFYPGAHVMLPIVAWGAAIEHKPEWGEVLPAWSKSLLNLLRASYPTGAGKLIDHIFPDRFRDYLTMLTLAELGHDADEIWRKKEQGVELSPEEEKLWLRAENKATGLKGFLFEQTGIFRLRPSEYTEVLDNQAKLLEEMTGVPVRIQEEIRRRYPVTGKRFSDYFHLDLMQQKLLYEHEAYKRWQGITTPLYPSRWQEEDIAVKGYYEEIETAYEEARTTGLYDHEGNLVVQGLNELTRQWIEGEIGPDQWVAHRGEMFGELHKFATRLHQTDKYKDVPITLEEREERYAERGIPAPTVSPDQEILYKYYELRPELVWDWEAGRWAYDFDTYYALADVMLDSMSADFRQVFIDRIQFDWTPMEKLYWNTSREYLRPYRAIRNLVMNEYTPAQRQSIRRFEVARGEERDNIQAMQGPEGKKLISHFTSRLREVRVELRRVDPTMDAWLYFFGKADKFVTDEAKSIYNTLTEQYLTKDMLE